MTLLALSGCATPPEGIPNAADTWVARQATLEKLNRWQVTGRVGVIQGQDGWHASFQWKQQDPNYRIDLTGPLGQGRVLIEGGSQKVYVQVQDGRQWSAPDPETALERSIGIRLPIKGLRYWVRGLPSPDAVPVQQTDEKGRLTRLEQNGWVIQYPAYTQIGTLDLPTRIIARHDDLSVKLVIEQWTL